jgi:multiple sugar transport system permease protein
MVSTLTTNQAPARDAERRPATRRGPRLHYSRRIQLWGFSFVLPTLLFFAVFKYGPMIWAVELSFTSYDMVSPPRPRLENFQSLAALIFRESPQYHRLHPDRQCSHIDGDGSRSTPRPGARYCMSVMFLPI